MERIELINEIIEFCLKYRLFNRAIRTDEIKRNIGSRLDDCIFVENLINTIVLKTRKRKNTDVHKIKNLLLELEKIRLDLEYNGRDKERLNAHS